MNPKCNLPQLIEKLLNDLLRSEYVGQLSFFDLARIEATSLNGNISSFSKDGETYLTLANEYTYDGGHLNEEKAAGEQPNSSLFFWPTCRNNSL